MTNELPPNELPFGHPDKPLWTMDDIAEFYGVKPKTIRTYRTRGRGELPPEDAKIGREPVWRPSTVINHPRPGSGHRTDLQAAPGDQSDSRAADD